MTISNFTRRQLFAYACLAPMLILMVAFTFYPTVLTFIHSFYSPSLGKAPSDYIGLENFETLISDEIFWKVLQNNIWFALATIPTSTGIALIMAIWVNKAFKGRGFVRLAYFVPSMLPMIAAANIWLFFYTPDYGLFDQISQAFGGGAHRWLGNKDTALPSVIVTVIWKESGFFMIFYLAALQNMPSDLAEAAALEGSGRWYFFRRVTLPLLMPTTLFVLISAFINSFKMIDMLFIMTNGGPNHATSLLLYYIFEVAFEFWHTGYAATLTIVLIIILAAISISQFFFFDKKVHYQ